MCIPSVSVVCPIEVAIIVVHVHRQVLLAALACLLLV